MTVDAKLDDDIDQQVQEALDVAARKFAAALILLHQQYQLLEGQLRTGRMNAGDGARGGRS